MRAGPSRRWILDRLVASGLLTPASLGAFAATAAGNGVNLGSLLRFAARRYGTAVALDDNGGALTFAELAAQCEQMAAALRDAHGIGRGDVVGILCRNGAGLVRGVFAAARLGARVTLLNPEMAKPQLGALIERHRIRLVIAEAGTAALLDGAVLLADDLLAASPAAYRPLPRVNGGELVVLTGGTTGAPKAAARKPSPLAFARLFLHLVAALGLDRYRAAFVGVPLFHGYGIAAFLVALTLGRTVHLTPRFDAGRACARIRDGEIEAAVVVPSMLRRMLAAPAELGSLRCVISGGAALPPALAAETRARLGDVLFNLYGTSEGGVAVFAAPADLAEAPDTIGREIWGVRVTVRGEDDAPVADGIPGRLCVESSAAISRRGWIETGDIGLRDPTTGRLFVRGRTDDMIVSGGENVSPWEVETVLAAHPEVRECAAVGVPDEEFGQRLVAFVVPRAGDAVTPDILSAWLADRLARYQRPRGIEIVGELPLTPIGKVDKRALAALVRHPQESAAAPFASSPGPLG
ncbi:MAG TPA: AMP-binding protein [Allosphingosinicella sp.]|jgi:acyl-CoA synthetase (AMP-forming)/AMP-acid ligase II